MFKQMRAGVLLTCTLGVYPRMRVYIPFACIRHLCPCMHGPLRVAHMYIMCDSHIAVVFPVYALPRQTRKCLRMSRSHVHVDSIHGAGPLSGCCQSVRRDLMAPPQIHVKKTTNGLQRRQQIHQQNKPVRITSPKKISRNRQHDRHMQKSSPKQTAAICEQHKVIAFVLFRRTCRLCPCRLL
jgi:hypothetical protein